jgi:predicted RNase H-like HicB family nuclease
LASGEKEFNKMRTFTAVVERDPDTGLYVGFVPGFRGAHTQGETLDELQKNLLEVIELLLEDGEPVLEAQYIGTQAVVIE